MYLLQPAKGPLGRVCVPASRTVAVCHDGLTLNRATERIARLMHLLKDLEANVDDAGRNKIDGVLESV